MLYELAGSAKVCTLGNVDAQLRARLVTFLRPLYQDLDGVSRFEDVERIAAIAHRIHPAASRHFELLLLFHGLGKWLGKLGNLSRVLLTVSGLEEAELREIDASIRKLEAPQSDTERAVAAAILIDNSGVRGLAQRFAQARREGHSVIDVVREALADSWIPEWVPAPARPMLEARLDARVAFCRAILDEVEIQDSELRTT
ncbi:MAG: hypothetical protein NVSMB68_16240 [Thermoanaerobaculia bacterium]